MAAVKLGLYDLLAPQFLVGFSFPESIHKYLSILSVDELQTTYDDTAVIYTGVLHWDGQGGATPEHRTEQGGKLTWDKLPFPFRLTVLRGSASPLVAAVAGNLNAAGQAMIAPPGGVPSPAAVVRDGWVLRNMSSLLAGGLVPAAGAPAGTPTDPPSLAFRLELMISDLSLWLGDSWKKAVYQDHRVVFDPADPSGEVRFVLPSAILEYTQAQGVGQNLPNPNFRLKSWGVDGFDAPADVAMGELIRMDPPIALHTSGRVGFGVAQVLLDLSHNDTPPEILEHFGTDEDWTGLFIKSARVYFCDSKKDWCFTIACNDALISTHGEVSLELVADLVHQSDFTMTVLLMDGPNSIDYKPSTQDPDPTKVVAGEAVVPKGTFVQVLVNGGAPPFNAVLTYDGTPLSWDAAKGHAQLPAAPQKGLLTVALTDARGTTRSDKIQISQAAKQLPAPSGPPRASFTQLGAPTGVSLTHTPAATGPTETLTLVGASSQGATLTVTNRATNQPVQVQSQGQTYTLSLPEDAIYDVRLDLAPSPAKDEYFHLLFDYERPRDTEIPGLLDEYASDFAGAPAFLDEQFESSTVPDNVQALPRADQDATAPPDPALRGAKALRAWLRHRVAALAPSKQIAIDAYASYEADPVKHDYNQSLSGRRLKVAYDLIARYNGEFPAATVSITNPSPPAQLTAVAHGHDKAAAGAQIHPGYPPAAVPGKERDGDEYDRVVVLVASVGQSGRVTGTLRRGKSVPSPKPIDPPPPAPPENKKPDLFRRAQLRLRLERGVLVLCEVSGELDFETETEASLRKVQVQGQSPPPGQGSFLFSDNPGDGVVEFLLGYSYDTSTSYLTEHLKLHSGEGDKDGLIQLKNPPGSDYQRLRDAMGAMMLLSPILAKATGPANLNNPADWAAMTASWAIPALIGGLGLLHTDVMTLYGGELRMRQYAPTANNVHFSDQAIIFDYGLEFRLDIDVGLVKIQSSKPLKVRYKAVGFNAHVPMGNGALQYQPIFDPSKGYEIDLSDPSLFNLGGLAGDLIKVLGARIARFNPLTLEVDLGLNADLGVVKVEELKVKWPIWDEATQSVGIPMIIPSAVSVDIPGTLKGGGRLHVLDDGFEGSLDITLIPVKVRIAAALAVRQIPQPGGGTVTAVFASLEVTFPSPIVLGATGLGIYGFTGLFAMHYKRLEQPRPPGDPVGPALAWLAGTNGHPEKPEFWGPELDRWSFGIGAILGSMDGGFLTNLRGLVLLELPGPRILICVKMQMIAELPGLGDGQLTVGLLGVLDLDFNLGQVTLGVLLDFTVEKLLQIKLPIELFFNWHKPSDWHLYLGTLTVPASADILGIIRGSGYFMIDGKGITAFPISEDETRDLPGTAVAAGIYAPMIWGSKDVGLYLEVSIRANVGFTFSPFFVAGNLIVRGELNLWVISIEAWADLTLLAPPAYFRGEICGEVDLVLFSAKGCVDIEWGESKPELKGFPELVSGVYLQSFAPVLAAGQGGERPIDASLGDAPLEDANGNLPAGATVPVVPVDAIPVVQLICSPLVGASGENWAGKVPTQTFTTPLAVAGGLDQADGYTHFGDRRCRYKVNKVVLQRRPTGSGAAYADAPFAAKPPSVWRKEKDTANSRANARIDLALGSRTPTPAAYALERSTELTTIVTEHWGSTCDPVAPPARVLWTLCGKALGTKADQSWSLKGTPLPDPPGTVRQTPPETTLVVAGPALSDDERLLIDMAEETGDPYLAPAKVVGRTPKTLAEIQQVRCYRGLQLPRILQHSAKGPLVPNKPAAYVAALNALKQKAYLDVHVGSCAEVRLLLLGDRSWDKGILVLEELDDKGVVLSSQGIKQAGAVEVAAQAALPSNWTAGSLPWAKDALPVFDHFAQAPYVSAGLKRLLLTRTPDSRCVTLRLRVSPQLTNKEFTLILGAVEILSKDEQARAHLEHEQQVSKEKTVKDFIEDGTPAPILEPGCDYRLQIHYTAEDDAGATQAVVRSFRFQTDAALPARLDPWVLATVPVADADFHFYGEAPIVAFNDTSALPLFATYNAKLRYVIRGADGKAVSPQQPPPNWQEAQPVDVSKLPDLEAPYGSPYFDTVVDKLPEIAPCVQLDKTTTDMTVLKIDAKLAPLMAYTLDVEPAALDPQKPMAVGKPKLKGGDAQGILPFFRRQFRTGRFADLHELAASVRATKIVHRALTGPIALTGATGTRADIDITKALMAAGEQALEAPRQNAVTVYWVAGKAHAILIDSVEPLWRTRLDPQLVPVQDPKAPGEPPYVYDDNFKRVEMVRVPSLELTWPAMVQAAYYAPGGARTVLLLAPEASWPAGKTLHVTLHRPPNSLLKNIQAEDSADLLAIPLGSGPPWTSGAND